jgi:hypothetical protein
MSEKQLPPNDLSILSEVERQWETIRTIVLLGQNADHYLRDVEARIENARRAIEKGAYDTDHDWELDLARSEIHHLRNLQWKSNTEADSQRHFQYWSETIKSNIELSQKITLISLQFLYAFNSAVALGALNGLANKTETTNYNAPLLFALSGALISISVAAIAQILTANTLADHAETVRSKIVQKQSWSRLRGLSRYTRRYGWKFDLSRNFLYGAGLATALYVVGAAIWLASV